MTALDQKLLGIYLQDHHAGSTAGLELVRRARGANEGTPLGDFLRGLADDIESDRRALERIMEQLGVGQDKPKVALAWATEKVGRLKPNGQLTGYSPLSRVVELEGLMIGVTGKLGLWRALRAVADSEPRLEEEYLDRLTARAEQQRDELEVHRVAAAEEAFRA